MTKLIYFGDPLIIPLVPPAGQSTDIHVLQRMLPFDFGNNLNILSESPAGQGFTYPVKYCNIYWIHFR